MSANCGLSSIVRRVFLFASFLPLAIGIATGIATAAATDKRLPIQPIPQYTKSWCWLAVLEMVFEHSNVPNGYPSNLMAPPDYDLAYQLDIAARVSAPGDPCQLRDYLACANHGAGTSEGATQQIVDALHDYPLALGLAPLSASSSTSALSSDDIVTEIDSNRPIIAGINTSGTVHGSEAEHAVLIVGYRRVLDSEGNETKFYVYVNDPFDYALAMTQGLISSNPWNAISSAVAQATGQYRVPLDDWTSAMPWIDTIDAID